MSRASTPNFTTLIQFTGTGGTASGLAANGSLIAVGGTLYGMTQEGGSIGDGNVFSVGMNGMNYQNLVSFTGGGGTASGYTPYGSLVASGSTLYGMTSEGGNGYGEGQIFSVGTNGTNYKGLVFFTGTGGTASGGLPQGSLIASGGTLYGMTATGGYGYGNIFSVGTNGANYRNLVSFTGSGGTAAGLGPLGSLIASGSTLFGMTQVGGVSTDGNVFSVGMNGMNYQNLVSFTGTGGTASGVRAGGSLIASGGTLYGMTQDGGTNGYGNVFSVGTNGTNYQNLLSLTGSGSSGTATGKWPAGQLGPFRYESVWHDLRGRRGRPWEYL